MTEVSVCEFDSEEDCIYDNERYSVRDNGAVLRYSRSGKFSRPNDNRWTFGKPNDSNGYMYITNVRVHRIVATAFHGEPPTKEHVVDHIDTNRRNNRPENLRWLTRLENVLKNPITIKRIEIICGSVEAFLENPSIFGHCKFGRNYEWMRTVSLEEAKACKERMHLWAKSDNSPSGGSLGEWVYKPIKIQKPLQVSSTRASDLETVKTPNGAAPNLYTPAEFSYHPKTAEEDLITDYEEKLKASGLVMAETPGAVQRKWSTPSEFPCCPQSTEENPITAYVKKLMPGFIFSRNCDSTSLVLESALADDNQSIWVMCQKAESDAIKPWSLAKVTYENDLYVHTSCGTFFMKDGAEKEFCLARGLEWGGSDTFDEYC